MPYIPDTSTPIETTERALALLRQQPLTEDALREARRLLAQASETVPYLGEARHCWEFRKNTQADTCANRLCGRCQQHRAAAQCPSCGRLVLGSGPDACYCSDPALRPDEH